MILRPKTAVSSRPSPFIFYGDINGDEILARVKDEGNDSLELDKPMTLQPVPTAVQGAMGMALVPWLLTGKSEKIKISISHVLVIDIAKDDVEKN